MLKIVLATANEHKIKEMNEISMPFGVEFELPSNGFNPVENGTSFEENSLIKALEAKNVEQDGRKYFMADDSGLCVDYLDGAPGIKSARFAPSADKRIEKLLEMMKGAPENERSAKFVCSLVLVDTNGEILNKTQGICKGKIAQNPSGNGGFGYDPIFIVENKEGKTMAELSEDEKNRVSHRGRAVMDMLMWIKMSELM